MTSPTESFTDRHLITLRRTLGAARGVFLTSGDLRTVLDTAITEGFVNLNDLLPAEATMWLLGPLTVNIDTLTPLTPTDTPRFVAESRQAGLSILRALADSGVFNDGPSALTFEDNGRRVVIGFTHPDGTPLTVQVAIHPNDFHYRASFDDDELDDDTFDVRRVREIARHLAVRAVDAVNGKVTRYEREQAKR